MDEKAPTPTPPTPPSTVENVLAKIDSDVVAKLNEHTAKLTALDSALKGSTLPKNVQALVYLIIIAVTLYTSVIKSKC